MLRKSLNKQLIKRSNFSSLFNILIRPNKNISSVASYHLNKTLKLEQQQPQPKEDKNKFIYDDEKSLEHELVPQDVFEDRERVLDDERPDINIPLFVKFWKLYFIRYTIITTLIFLVAYTLYFITDWLSSITFKNVAKFSFYSGFFSGIISCIVAWLTVIAFSIHPTTVYKAALKKVLSNHSVRTNLATPVKPAKFRAYSYTYPDMNNSHDVPIERKLQFWKPKRMQMMFQLEDAKGKLAMVSCDVSRKPGFLNLLRNRFTFHSLSVDIPDNEDRLILRGDAESDVFNEGVKLN